MTSRASSGGHDDWDKEEDRGIWAKLKKTALARWIGNSVNVFLDMSDTLKNRHPTLFDLIIFFLAIFSAALYIFSIKTDITVAREFYDIDQTVAFALTVTFIAWHYPFLGALLAFKFVLPRIMPKARSIEEADGEFSITNRRSALIGKFLYVWVAVPIMMVGASLVCTCFVPFLDFLMLCLELIFFIPTLRHNQLAAQFELFLLQYRTLRMPLMSMFESLPQTILQLFMFLHLRNSPQSTHFKLETVTMSLVSSALNLIKNTVEVYLAVAISGRSTMMYLRMAFQFEGAAMLSPRWDRAVVKPVVLVDDDYPQLSLAQQMKIIQCALRRPVVEIASPDMSALLKEHEFQDSRPTAAAEARRLRLEEPHLGAMSVTSRGSQMNKSDSAHDDDPHHLSRSKSMTGRGKMAAGLRGLSFSSREHALLMAMRRTGNRSGASARARAETMHGPAARLSGDGSGSDDDDDDDEKPRSTLVGAVIRIRTRKMVEFLMSKQEKTERMIEEEDLLLREQQHSQTSATMMTIKQRNAAFNAGKSADSSSPLLPPGAAGGDGAGAVDSSRTRPLLAQKLKKLNYDRPTADYTLLDVRIDGAHMLPLTDEKDRGHDLHLDLDDVEEEADKCAGSIRILQLISHPRLVLYLRHVTLVNCALDATSCPLVLDLVTANSSALRSLELSSNPLFVRWPDESSPIVVAAKARRQSYYGGAPGATGGGGGGGGAMSRAQSVVSRWHSVAGQTAAGPSRATSMNLSKWHNVVGQVKPSEAILGGSAPSGNRGDQQASEHMAQMSCPTRLHPETEAVDCAAHMADKLPLATGLVRLCLSQTKMRPSCVRALWGNLHLHPRLTSVDISNNPIGADGAAFIGENLPRCQLQELYLSDTCIDGSGPGFSSLAAGLQANTTLLRLDLSYNPIDKAAKPAGPSGPAQLAEALAQNKWLQEIILAGTGLSPRGADELAHGLSQNMAITAIDLSGNRLGDFGATSLAHAITKRGGGLRRISISAANLSGVGIADLCASLSSKDDEKGFFRQLCSTAGTDDDEDEVDILGEEANRRDKCLTHLDLSYNWLASHIGKVQSNVMSPSEQVQDAVQAIVRVLRHQPLVELGLARTMMPTVGAQILAEGLAGHSTLTRLDLSNNPLCTEGAEHIFHAVARLPALTSLALAAANIGSPAFQNIVQAMIYDNHLAELDLSQNFIQDCPVRLFWEFCCRNNTLRLIDLRWNNMPNSLCSELMMQFHSHDRGKTTVWQQLAKNMDEQPYKMML